MENLVKLEMLDLQDLKDREAQRCVLIVLVKTLTPHFFAITGS